MKTNTFFLCFLLLCASIVFWGCPRKEKPATPLDQNFLKYVAFPKGSWWVYVEKNSLKRDSLYVDYYWIEEDYLDPADIDSKMEKLKYRLVSVDTIRDYQIFTTEYKAPKHSDLIQLQCCGFSSNFYLRLYSPTTGNFHSDDSAFHVQYLDTFRLDNGILHTDVFRSYRYEAGQWEPYIKSEVYAKNIGLIRREQFNGKIWEIEKYQIQP